MRATLSCLLLLLVFAMMTAVDGFAASPAGEAVSFPPPIQAYGDQGAATTWSKLTHRAAAEPFNVVATILFLLAIIHTFLAAKITRIAHRWRDEHAATRGESRSGKLSVSFKAEVLHFLGEVEAIFGIWVLPMLIAFAIFKGWPAVENYFHRGVAFTEPMFVVVIMCIAATRPILRFAERSLQTIANFGGGTPGAWWLSILTVGPLLGSFITEPAAMTICALVLARRFYAHNPSTGLRYATLGLLFVNISVGGTITHFAAPPVLMVAGKWGWGTAHMITHFGWKAVIGILIANSLYYAAFRKEFTKLKASGGTEKQPDAASEQAERVPRWITLTHLSFLGWTVFAAHHPAFFVGGFLFFLAFTAATEHHQDPLSLRPAMLVGFFLAGLVVHGGLQAWWIEPILSGFAETTLMLGAAVLTVFNDNAAITYLATLVPNLTDGMKHAVVAGAVAGGGLTVIANAPNPAGQSILSAYFPDGVSPLRLAAGALAPTLIVGLLFKFL